MYEIYPGIKGNTQGDRKLIKPAPNAIRNSVINLYFSLLQIFLQLMLGEHHLNIFDQPNFYSF